MPEQPARNVISWATDLDEKTLEQAARSASLPFIEGPVALMPDAHFGYGATIGSVIPTQGAIIPSAVGVDIGCGMIAARLLLTADQLPDDLTGLHSMIAKEIPAGVGKGHDNPVTDDPSFKDLQEAARKGPVLSAKQWEKALKQFGTLGSGNHFVEICIDEIDRVWMVLHSGSRGIGNELANIHIDGAKKLMKQYFIDLPDPDLAYLVEGTPEFHAYIFAMLWAQDYAMQNRETMVDAAWAAICGFVGKPIPVAERINCHHNYTERENHRGKNVWLTRKGAIRAREGDRGVIPGSMGAASFIVKGLGNPLSYNSCSHGAGRRMSRNAARKQLDLETFRESMEGKAWNNDAASLIDEDPRAYKDIDEVMANQKDLVEIEHVLHQVLNYKGT
jgi:tRNA-splicing ligase RtcB